MTAPRELLSARGDDRAARETVLSSSRMFPGQWYCTSRSSPSFENDLPSSASPLAAQYLARKRCASTGMSTVRSRSDGKRIEKALTR